MKFDQSNSLCVIFPKTQNRFLNMVILLYKILEKYLNINIVKKPGEKRMSGFEISAIVTFLIILPIISQLIIIL